MCIFAFPVSSVTETKIFLAPVRNPVVGGPMLQLTVYKNDVARDRNGNPVVMILPVPKHKNHSTIRFVSMVDTPKFFNELDRHFESIHQTRGEGGNVSKSLSVTKCGSYEISVALTISDIDRIEGSVFKNIPPKIRELLENHYSDSNKWSFIICQSKAENSKFEPFAYVSASFEGQMMFAPTRHEHDPPTWDHTVYVAGSILPSHCLAPAYKSFVKVAEMVQDQDPTDHVDPSSLTSKVFDMELFPCLRSNLFKMVIRGAYPNEDLIFNIQGIFPKVRPLPIVDLSSNAPIIHDGDENDKSDSAKISKKQPSASLKKRKRITESESQLVRRSPRFKK